MKAIETNLATFINKEQQFIIPIYQRTYSWNISQCKQLWKDIVNAATDETVPAHFIGSIVYVAAGMYNIAGTHQSLVIDGQQRLTTLSLLFLAFKKKLEDSGETYSITADQIEEQFLINKYASSEDMKIKLQLTRHDKDIYNRLVRGEQISTKEQNNRVYQNFKYFTDQINSSAVGIDDLFKGIRKLIIVDIALDREDNPQLIFESLNSTGLDLSQSDLIRNYVLMGLEKDAQEEIYGTYWLPMERIFMEAQAEEKFDAFMRSYLTIRTGSIPKLDAVYAEFKKYILGKDTDEVVSDVYKYSQYYNKLEFGNEEDGEIREILTNIRTLKVEVAHPFLLSVYDDYINSVITKENFSDVLKLVESYVFRRAVTGIPTNSLNKTFAQLYKEIDKDNYLESLRAIFILKSSYQRFPTDEEFRTELINKDIYSFRNNKYFFEKLEFYKNKERVNIDDLSVEHIMPQTLTSKWKDELGEDFQRIKDTYLHTVGNLTLTGYNSDMSNKTFAEKRDMQKGFKESSVRLNKDLITLDTWTEEEIKKRAQKLSKLAVEVWRYSDLSVEILDKYKKVSESEEEIDYSIDDYVYLQGEMLTLYELLKENILALDPEIVKEEYKKLYIAFKTGTNFIDVVPQKSRLRLSLNMKFSDVDDPKGLTKDVTDLGRWGNGDVEISLTKADELEDVMELVKQSFESHK